MRCVAAAGWRNSIRICAGGVPPRGGGAARCEAAASCRLPSSSLSPRSPSGLVKVLADGAAVPCSGAAHIELPEDIAGQMV